jgi:hypothetical protein
MDIYTVAMFYVNLPVTVTREKQYSTGFGPIVKCYTDRIYPICTESYKVAKASTFLSVISTLLYVISALLSIMGHWEFCTKALPRIISYYVIVLKEKSEIIIKNRHLIIFLFKINYLWYEVSHVVTAKFC